MKKNSLILSISAVMMAGLFFASCSTERGLSIEKRHYTKGYYVHSNGNRADEKTTVIANTTSTNESNITPTTVTVSSNTFAENPKQPDGITSQAVVKQNSPLKKTTASSHSSLSTVKSNSVEKTTAASQATVQPKVKKAESKKAGGGDVNGALLVLLCLFIPPLAVFLVDGIGTSFWIDLILCLLFFLPGIIYAFIVCFA